MVEVRAVVDFEINSNQSKFSESVTNKLDQLCLCKATRMRNSCFSIDYEVKNSSQIGKAIGTRSTCMF